MMQLMTQLSMMAAEAEESTEERVERLETVAEDSAVDENTLYDAEEEIRRYVKHRLENLDGEEREKVDELKQQAPAMLGVPPEDVEDVVAVIAARMIVAKPERVASIVNGLDTILHRSDLYEEVDAEAPSPDDLPEPVDLDVGEVDVGQPGDTPAGLDGGEW